MPEGIGYSGSNVVAGAGLELNYVGSKVYAYSGLYVSSTTSSTKLLFTTGKNIIEGQFQLNMPVDDDAPQSGTVSSANILFNGITIAIISGSSVDAGSNRTVTQNVILPPFTSVEVIVDSTGNESDQYGSMTFVGTLL